MRYFRMPDLGEGLTEAEVVNWHVSTGDRIEADQVLVTVETAKALVDMPSPQTGVIGRLFVKAGEIIHTGEPLLEFADQTEEDQGTVVGQLKADAAVAIETESFTIGPSASSARFGTLEGAEPLQGVRKAMARNMARAGRVVVPVSLFEDADIDHWPGDEDTTLRLILAVAVAARAEPALNAWFDGRAMTRKLHETVDLGIAVDTADGLFVPVMRDVGGRTPEDLKSGLERLKADVKARTIPPEEMIGSTLMLTNFGTLAGRYGTPVIVPPNVAIVGAGVMRVEPVAVGREVRVHRRLPLTLSFDHRCVTGAEAARFLSVLKSTLEAAG